MFFDRSTDGPSVVTTYENNWCFHYCCKVHSSMKISLHISNIINKDSDVLFYNYFHKRDCWLVFIITNLTSTSIPTKSDCTSTFSIHFERISSAYSLRKLCSEFLAKQRELVQKKSHKLTIAVILTFLLQYGIYGLRNRRRDCEVIVFVRAIVYWHLSSFTKIICVSKALMSKLLQSETTP